MEVETGILTVSAALELHGELGEQFVRIEFMSDGELRPSPHPPGYTVTPRNFRPRVRGGLLHCWNEDDEELFVPMNTVKRIRVIPKDSASE